MVTPERRQPEPPRRFPLAAVDLVGGYEGRRVLHGVTLPVEQGRITVLMGPSGAGKTTCVRHLVGLSLPWEGRVLVHDRDIRELTDDALRSEQRRMSVMLQGSTLFGGGLAWSLSVFENVAYPLRLRTTLGEDAIAERVRGRLAQVGMADHADAPLSSLSAGMVQRVSLARALVSESEIVVLDSPETGVDGVCLHAVIEAIRAAHRDTRATFLIATHHLELTRALADVLAVIRAGRIEAIGPPDLVVGDDEGFAAHFVRGHPGDGLTMADAAEGRPPSLPEVVNSRWPRAEVLLVVAAIGLIATVVAIVVALVVFRGPSLPAGR